MGDPALPRPSKLPFQKPPTPFHDSRSVSNVSAALMKSTTYGQEKVVGTGPTIYRSASLMGIAHQNRSSLTLVWLLPNPSKYGNGNSNTTPMGVANATTPSCGCGRG